MTAVDFRLTRARDALDAAALHPVASLPPSVMARELAELPRTLASTDRPLTAELGIEVPQ